LNDTTFNQKNADIIQKYVKNAGRKIHCISSFISTYVSFEIKSDLDSQETCNEKLVSAFVTKVILT
jgi:hypothetical protein